MKPEIRLHCANVCNLNIESRQTDEREFRYAKYGEFDGLSSEYYFYEYPRSEPDHARKEFKKLVELFKTNSANLNNKKLILHVRSILEPEFLRSFLGCFSKRYIFSEFWGKNPENSTDYPDNVFGIPVSCSYKWMNSERRSRPVTGNPQNTNVFLSLGRSDDFALINAVVQENPNIQFIVPDVYISPDGSYATHNINGPNVTVFNHLNYLDYYGRCDTILIAPLYMTAMKGGLRIADALGNWKYFITTHNDANETVMALDEETCLVTAPTVNEVSKKLHRILSGEFQVNLKVYSELSRLTDPAEKFKLMLSPALTAPLNGASLVKAPKWQHKRRSIEYPPVQLENQALYDYFRDQMSWELKTVVFEPNRRRFVLNLETTRNGSLTLLITRNTNQPLFLRHGEVGLVIGSGEGGKDQPQEDYQKLRTLGKNLIRALMPMLVNSDEVFKVQNPEAFDLIQSIETQWGY